MAIYIDCESQLTAIFMRFSARQSQLIARIIYIEFTAKKMSQNMDTTCILVGESLLVVIPTFRLQTFSFYNAALIPESQAVPPPQPDSSGWILMPGE